MSNKSPQPQFAKFAAELKTLRAQASRTPAEVCSAVEIDEERLKSYEAGEQLPTEDILLLLINHFDLNESQAQALWKLAGYAGKPSEEVYFGDIGSDELETGDALPRMEHAIIGLSIQDPRIVYTDMVQIMANDHGVIMNFMQGAGNSKQPLAAAKVGMSKEHAYSVLKMLQKTLDEADANSTPKQLGESAAKSNDDKTDT